MRSEPHLPVQQAGIGQGKQSFLEKKDQKTFAPVAVSAAGPGPMQPAGLNLVRDSAAKSFLPRFLKKAGLFCFLALIVACQAKAAPRRIPLTPPGTQAEFTTYAMGVWPLTGHFTRFTGQISIDPAQKQSCTATLQIDVSSLQMADTGRATTALGPKLLDQPHFPTLTYSGSCAGGHASGLLTLHGITRPLVLSSTRAGQVVTATGTLHRQDYGIDGLPGLIGRTIKLSFAVSLPDEVAALVDP